MDDLNIPFFQNKQKPKVVEFYLIWTSKWNLIGSTFYGCMQVDFGKTGSLSKFDGSSRLGFKIQK